jgi:polyisoprenoid-binding protein YceI
VSDNYTYDPHSWNPILAGVVAGAIAAVVGGVLSFFLRSPDEIVANSLAVVLVSLAIGGVSGLLWRRLRATNNGLRTYGWTIAGGFFVSLIAIAIADQSMLSNLVRYAAPIAALIFITVGFLTPLLDGVTAPAWTAAIPIVLALAIGVGLFGRGNVASGELSLDDLDSTATTTTQTDTASDDATGNQSTTTAGGAATLSGTLTVPDDLAASYTVASAAATYSVKEVLRGLSAVGVGSTDALTGSVVPGESFGFVIDLQSFTSDQERRDSKVREWFADHPLGSFSGAEFPLPDDAVVGEIASFDVTGSFTVNDITKDVTWEVEARIEEDGSLSVTGQTSIVLSEFDVPVLSGGFVEMEDGATLEILFSATPTS